MKLKRLFARKCVRAAGVWRGRRRLTARCSKRVTPDEPSGLAAELLPPSDTEDASSSSSSPSAPTALPPAPPRRHCTSQHKT